MFAIINTRTNKWMYGTDFRFTPARQRTSTDKAMLFSTMEEAQYEFSRRKCGKAYKIVAVTLSIKE